VTDNINQCFFTVKLHENYVFEINSDSPDEAKSVYNTQRDSLSKEMHARLVKPNFTFDKKFIHVENESTLAEIEKCTERLGLEITIPDIRFHKNNEFIKFVYRDPDTNELKFGTREKIKEIFNDEIKD